MKVDISRDSLICILSRNGLYYPCCSSQEEHVLKLNYTDVEYAVCSCSSQEEHVLKLYPAQKVDSVRRCSSQEEHVLKHLICVMML